MSVTVKNKINEKWLKNVIYSFSEHVRKPKLTDNKQAAYKFDDLNRAVEMLESLNFYSFSEWTFYEDGELVEIDKVITCANCGKRLRGDDTVYYLDLESSLPYCSPRCLKDNLDIDEVLAKYWSEN